MSIRLASLAAISVFATACNFGDGADAKDRDPGPEVSRNYQVGAFNKIAVAGPYEVNVVSGGSPGISAKGGQNLLEETEVVVEGDTLKIMPKKRKGFRWGWSDHGKAVFTVNAANLSGAAIAGSGGIHIDQTKTASFKGEVAGSGDLKVDGLEAQDVELSIAGSGNITAAGKTGKVAANIAGSGDLDAKGLIASDADVNIAGSGNIMAHATSSADVSIMGSGDVEVTGGAKCNVNKHGSGDVRCS